MRLILLFLALFCVLSVPVASQTSSNIIDIDTRYGEGSNPVNFTLFKNKVYFYATDSLHGTELWVTDGNTASIVADINPGVGSCLYNYNRSTSIVVRYCMQVIGDTLYFAATDDLSINPSIYKYDGINPPSIALDLRNMTYQSFSAPGKFTNVNNVLYFVADTSSGSSAIISYEPITGKGRIVNTVKVYPNTPLIPWGNKLLFCGEDSLAGFEIHMYNPATRATKMMVDYTIPGNTTLLFYRIFDNRIYLKAGNLNGAQLYEFDGDTTIKNISLDSVEGTSLQQLQNTVNPFCFYNHELYYSAIKNGKRHIYSYNPATGKKTYRIPVKLYPGAVYLVAYKGKLYYADSSFSVYDFNSAVTKLTDLYQLPATVRLSLNHYIEYKDVLITAAFVDSSRDVELVVLHDSTLSIKDIHEEISTTLYPNPTARDANLDITLKEAQSLFLQVLDINGR
ncbi:MAG TPA: hypothetical protein VIN07_13235, partial [Flavipsychrobacter sp.]